ncbi:MAG: flavin reductase [Clostridiales bacterium]|nr:flavin reductase [Clostridiales bacterium]
MGFERIGIRDVKENVVKLICDDWALLTAGTQDAYNTMTVSWGAVGELWAKDAVFVFVRPQRHTMQFVEGNDTFSLSFFEEARRSALKLCGSKSGRDLDKAAAAGITPAFDCEAPYFEEAKLVVLCRKLAAQNLDPASFLDSAVEKCYPEQDYHRMFVGEITGVLRKV